MRLSSNFTVDELLASQTATRHNIEEQFAPSAAVVENLRKLTNNILQPLRDKLGLPVIITSGYRCKRLNRKIGGAINSQHTEGKAADIRVPNMTTQTLYELIHDLGLPYDQLIQEFDSWVHVSYDDKRHRRQRLRAIKKNGKTQYINEK